jgi:phenylacetate-CoA oxygenase PaaI subunit
MSATQSKTTTETLVPPSSPGISDPKQYDDATRHALADFILALADNKRVLGLRYAEWSDGAPALEASVAASAMAQDELGHSRALLPMLKDFPEVDPAIPDEAPRERYSSIAFLDSEFQNWATFVAANVLIGTALTIALEAARESSYVPLKTRAVKILEEERFHWMHGEGWFKRLANDAREGLELSFQIEEILPHALCWLGASNDDRLPKAGIMDANGDELRARFMNRVGPLLAKSQASGLVKIESGKWQYARNLPWMKFDVETRRLK